MFGDYDVYDPEPEQGWQDNMQICLNGHVINDRCLKNPEDNKNFCDKCGAKTITECLECNELIPGVWHEPLVTIGYQLSAPDFCGKCGAALPWTPRKKAESLEAETAKSIKILQRIFSKFHSIAKRLRNRYNKRESLLVKDEYDVQDLMSALLVLYFDDVRHEEWTPSYAGRSSRMDFLLKKDKIVVEAKMTRQGLADKELGDQLIVDIERYKEHPDCDTLICFIYDPEGLIRNSQGIIEDLERQSRDSLKVVVAIDPL